jgi:hypothetical protein
MHIKRLNGLYGHGIAIQGKLSGMYSNCGNARWQWQLKRESGPKQAIIMIETTKQQRQS